MQTRNKDFASQVIPKREYLRLIVVDSDGKMKTVQARLAKGDSFSTVAHDLSIDPTAPGGGFIGDMALADTDPQLAAAVAHLAHDANSDVVHISSNQMILHRLSRDFKWKADQLFQEAVELNNRGERTAAVAKNQQALDEYPYLLRGLILMEQCWASGR